MLDIQLTCVVTGQRAGQLIMGANSTDYISSVSWNSLTLQCATVCLPPLRSAVPPHPAVMLRVNFTLTSAKQ